MRLTHEPIDRVLLDDGGGRRCHSALQHRERAAGPAVPACATLLTADELTKSIGEKMQDMGPRVRDSGESECGWMLRGGSKGFKTVSVQFYDMKVIKASPAAPTLPAFFEQIVLSGEVAASGHKREMLPGIGDKAAFV